MIQLDHFPCDVVGRCNYFETKTCGIDSKVTTQLHHDEGNDVFDILLKVNRDFDYKNMMNTAVYYILCNLPPTK